MSALFRAARIGAVVAFALPTIAITPAVAKKAGDFIRTVDTDNDGTIDLKEIQAAASATFARLDPDKDGTLDAAELKGRLSPADLKRADPDGDGTLDRKEFLALVEALFKKADPDGDGTLDAKELKSPAGKRLTRLLK